MPSCLRWREQCPRPTQSSPPNPIGSTLLVALKLLSIYNMRCKANDSSSYIILCILIIIHIFSLFLIWLLVLMPFIFNYGAKWSNKPWEMTWERMVVVDCPLWTPFFFYIIRGQKTYSHSHLQNFKNSNTYLSSNFY